VEPFGFPASYWTNRRCEPGDKTGDWKATPDPLWGATINGNLIPLSMLYSAEAFTAEATSVIHVIWIPAQYHIKLLDERLEATSRAHRRNQKSEKNLSPMSPWAHLWSIQRSSVSDHRNFRSSRSRYPGEHWHPVYIRCDRTGRGCRLYLRLPQSN
jgi:hypothetical protein